MFKHVICKVKKITKKAWLEKNYKNREYECIWL